MGLNETGLQAEFSFWTAALHGSYRATPSDSIHQAGFPQWQLAQSSCRALGVELSKTQPKKNSWLLNLLHVTANKGATLDMKRVHLMQAK